MEEIEVPTEHLQEEIHHQAEHSRENWISWVALSSALLAVLAAVTGLLAGHTANEAMLEQIQSSNKWAYYQSKSIKLNLLTTKDEILKGLKQEVSEKDQDKMTEYKKELEEISESAKEKETTSARFLHQHEIFARGVTMFQVAIGIAAISVLLRRRRFWLVAMGFGLVGTLFLIQGLTS